MITEAGAVPFGLPIKDGALVPYNNKYPALVAPLLGNVAAFVSVTLKLLGPVAVALKPEPCAVGIADNVIKLTSLP